MRILLALIYIGLGMWIYFQLGGSQIHVFFGLIWCTFLVLSSVVVCNEGFIRLLKGQSDEEYIKELLENELAVEEQYKAGEVITFEDLSTGCLCHLISIGAGEVLCLYGQYLYDYAEIDDDPETNQHRQFPTSSFSLVRKLKSNEVLQLNIGDKVISETKFESVNLEALYDFGVKLEDGQLIKNLPFSNLYKVFA